jgi:hypothetical protein
VILDDDDDSDEAGAGDKAEGASRDVSTGRGERDASPQNTFAISELAFGLIESVDTSGPWYDIEEGRYIEEPVPGPGPREQQGVPSALVQGQTQTLPQSSAPLQDEIDQQDIDEITWSMLMGSVPHSLPQPSNTGDSGWTDDLFDELDKELGFALKDEGRSSSACAPTSRSRSAEASQDKIQRRECIETIGSRPAELQDTSRCGTPAPGLEWRQRQAEEVVEGGGVAMQQWEEDAAQKDELGQPAVGGQQDPIEVEVGDDTEPQGKLVSS